VATDVRSSALYAIVTSYNPSSPRARTHRPAASYSKWKE
jgi:hypothetical protein